MLMDDRHDRTRQIQQALRDHEGPLVRYVTHLLGGDAHRAADVVQETFFKLWRAHPPVGDGAAAAWLFKVARNGAISVLRKEKRMTYTSDIPAATGQPQPSACDVADQREQLGQAVAAMQTLPTRQQEVLRLKFQNEFSYRQIAEITGLTVSHVGVLIHTGVKQIQILMETGA